MASERRIRADGADRADGGARRVLADAAGRVWRARPRQGGDVRRLRGIIPRLYRRRLARHALGDRRRADPQWRHRRTESGMAAEDRLRRNPADGGVHRAEHGLGPRIALDTRGEGRRCLSHHRAEDLDHACGARRSDDRAGAHQSEREGLSRIVDVPRAEAARHRRQSFSSQGHEWRRDRGARLSRHEGVRHLLRRVSKCRPPICSVASRVKASSS